MQKLLGSIDLSVNRLLRGAAMLLVIALLGVVGASVILRPFGLSFYGTDELSRLLLSWTIAVGACLGANERGHLAVEVLTDRLSGRLRHVTLTVALSTVFVFLVVLLWTGIRYAMAGFDSGIHTPGLGISPGWGMLAWPAAAVVLLGYAARDIANRVRMFIRNENEIIEEPPDVATL